MPVFGIVMQSTIVNFIEFQSKSDDVFSNAMQFAILHFIYC